MPNKNISNTKNSKIGKYVKGDEANFALNSQFPFKITESCKTLYPIIKQHREKINVPVVDKLYIEGQLYHDPYITL